MKRFNKRWMLAAALVPLFGTSQACDFHNDPMFGSFGGFHPIARANRGFNYEPKLVLNYQKNVTVKVNQAGEVNLEYILPMALEDLTLEFQGSEAIELTQQQPIAINDSEGRLVLPFKAKLPGEHSIEILAKAKNKDVPYTLIKYVRVFAE